MACLREDREKARMTRVEGREEKSVVAEEKEGTRDTRNGGVRQPWQRDREEKEPKESVDRRWREKQELRRTRYERLIAGSALRVIIF